MKASKKDKDAGNVEKRAFDSSDAGAKKKQKAAGSTDAVGKVLKIRQITDPAALTNKDPVHSVEIVGAASVRDVVGEAFAALNVEGALADFNVPAVTWREHDGKTSATLTSIEWGDLDAQGGLSGARRRDVPRRRASAKRPAPPLFAALRGGSAAPLLVGARVRSVRRPAPAPLTELGGAIRGRQPNEKQKRRSIHQCEIHVHSCPPYLCSHPEAFLYIYMHIPGVGAACSGGARACANGAEPIRAKSRITAWPHKIWVKSLLRSMGVGATCSAQSSHA